MSENLPGREEMLSAYRPLVEDNDQAIPLLVFWDSTHGGQFLPLSTLGMDHPTDALAALVPVIKEVMDPVWAVLSTEIYMAPVSKEEVGSIQRGELARRSAAGDAKVEEAALITGVHRDGSHWTVIAPFIREEVGKVTWVTWNEPEVPDSGEGRLQSLLQDLVTPAAVR